MMLSLCYQTHLKGAVTRQTITFLFSLFATKLENVLVDDKITALCETNVPPMQFIKRNKQQKRTFKKIIRQKQVSRNQNCNPFQSSLSLPIRASFCICCVKSLERLFLKVSLHSVAVPTV